MGDGAHFWRNVGIIAGAHVALVIAFVHWGGARKTEVAQQVVWLGANLPTEASTGSHPVARATPEPTEIPEPEEQPTIARDLSEIQLPVPTPTQTPRPIVKLSPVPIARPTQIPKLVAKSTLKKVTAKATPKPKPKPTAAPAESDEDDDADVARNAIGKIAGAASAGGGSGPGGNSARAETQWYGRMLHDRFHNAWDQPTTVVASGTKMSALVRVRIDKSGHVSRFDIVKPTGNVVVDESVRAVASKVTQLDPLPVGVGNGDHYDVTINFELNPEE
jgi:TonB family protein